MYNCGNTWQIYEKNLTRIMLYFNIMVVYLLIILLSKELNTITILILLD
jgi:hypothetical protein